MPDDSCQAGGIAQPSSWRAYGELQDGLRKGTSGSFSTIHAESAREALQKLGMHLLAAEPNVDARLIGEWISQSLHILVTLAKHPMTGQRAVMQISEVAGLEGSIVRLEDLWIRESFDASSRLHERFRRYGVDASVLRPNQEQDTRP
jgi:pilus assembly protein CpaF